MHKPETTNRSHSHNRGCIKPGTVHSCGCCLRFELALAMSVWQRRDGLRWHILDACLVCQLFRSLR
jgi:hypothetical protein